MRNIIKNFRLIDCLQILLIIILIYFQVSLELKIPEYLSKIVEIIYIRGNTSDILNVGTKMLLMAFLVLVMAGITGFLIARLAAHFSYRLRNKIYEKIDSFNEEEMNKFSTPSLITRTTNDVQQVQMCIGMGLRFLIMAPIMAFKAITKIIENSNGLTFVIVIGVITIISTIIIIAFFVTKRFELIQKKQDKLNLVARENLMGIRVVRAYNNEKYQEDKFEKVNEDLVKNNIFVNRMISILNPVMIIVMNGISLTIVWLGAHLINNGNLDFALIIPFTMYSMHVIMSFMFIVMIFMMVPRAIVSGKRIGEVLETEVRIKDGSINEISESFIEFNNVSFKYPDGEDYVLKNISFKLEKGETLVIVGGTGSGKSTLAKLIARIYDVSDGEVKIGNNNVKDYNLKYLRDCIGYVPQKAMLFKDSIRNNVSLGKNEASDIEVNRAIDIARASDFVNKYSDNINHEIARGGTNVSGGQKQRLSIARAIIKDPKIYVFDDSFSALDYETDRLLKKALDKECKDSTRVIIAQRLSTVLKTNKILVLDKGEIVGFGSHKELMKNCHVYQEMAYSQLSKEELENV